MSDPRGRTRLEQLALGSNGAMTDGDPLDASFAEHASALLVPEGLTPLPDVDRAMPVLRLFGTIAGSRRARLRIAVLKTLQQDGAASWRVARIREVIHWLAPDVVTAVVTDLRAQGVLAYDEITGLYRLTPEARVVVAVLEALTVPQLEPRRLIRFLKEAMALALAAGAGDDVLFAQFRSAVAVLRADEEELDALIDERSDCALLAAAERIQEHVQDMRDLMQEYRTFFATHFGDPRYLRAQHDALDLVRRLGELTAETIHLLSGRAEDRMRGGLHIDRADLREFLATTPLDALAALVRGLAASAPAVGDVPMAAAFESLEYALGRQLAAPPPLPTPARTLPAPFELHDDVIARITGELRDLSLPTTVADLVVRDSWETSVARHGGLLAAYSGGDAARLPRLRHEIAIDEVRRAGVWKVSRSHVEPVA